MTYVPGRRGQGGSGRLSGPSVGRVERSRRRRARCAVGRGTSGGSGCRRRPVHQGDAGARVVAGGGERATLVAAVRRSVARYCQTSWPWLRGGRSISRLPVSAISSAWPRAKVQASSLRRLLLEQLLQAAEVRVVQPFHQQPRLGDGLQPRRRLRRRPRRTSRAAGRRRVRARCTAATRHQPGQHSHRRLTRDMHGGLLPLAGRRPFVRRWPAICTSTCTCTSSPSTAPGSSRS